MNSTIRAFKIAWYILLLSAAIGVFGNQAAAQEVPSSIKIGGQTIALPHNAGSWLTGFSAGSAGRALVLLQLAAPAGEAAKNNLSLSGIELCMYLTDRTYIAKIEKSSKLSSAAGNIISIVPVQASWKVAPAIAQSLNSTGAIDVMISILPGEKPEDVTAQIAAAGGSIRQTPIADHGFYEVSVPAAKLMQIAAQPQVLYISAAAKDVPLNLESQHATKANVAHAPVSIGGWGLLGDSITVGVGDNTSGLYHIDLRERIINYNPSGYANHGQHTNGTVGGAGTIDPLAEGFVPHVQLVDHIYNLVWERTGAMLQAHNMTVTNNSYANQVGDCAAAGTYDVYAQAIDTIMLQYPSVLHVFASGNDGGMTCPPYPTGFQTVVGGYQTAKNVLVVANVTKQYLPNGGTSRGPIKDGRLKPEISAVGSDVWSTKGVNIYQFASGTSMACPQIVGSAAMLQQRYKQLHGGAYPSSALTKALLMNGAMDVGNPGPDFTYGFGMVDLTRSLTMMDSNRYVQGSIAHSASQVPVTISVPANTGRLKVMLYWHDAPASPMASTQLVNDLDLRVADPASMNRLPFILNPAASGVTNNATTGADHLNNVEQVVIDNPATGNYTVNVSGYNVVNGPQAYVVVYDLTPSGITLTTPYRDDSYKSDIPQEIYWNAAPGANTFTIEYSTNNGSSWTTLSSSVPADEHHFTWTPANINSAQCKVRITRNVSGEQAVSGAFTINAQPLVQLSSVQCPGYVNIHWSPVPNVTGYNILRKKGLYLQKIGSTADTFYSAGGLSLDSTYFFTAQPVFGTASGFRGVAVIRQAGTGTCAGAFSDGDLMAEKILTPSTGRVGTSSALTASEALTVQVRNLDDAAAASYRVSYQLNGGAWTSQTMTLIPANSTAVATFAGLNMAAPGVYVIRAAVTNLLTADGVPQNDTVVKVVRQLQNAAVNLAAGFTDDFETLPRFSLQTDSSGFTPNEHWDYYNSYDTGRLRSFVDGDITIGGARSLTMDMILNTRAAFNSVTGTFNLAGTSTVTDEVRFEFDYKLHGKPSTQDSNRVWVRGADTQSWVRLYNYDFSVMPGDVKNSGTLSLTDALTAAGQSFSSSTQLAFGQYDTSVLAQNDYGNGLTIDNVKLYKVVNDIGITAVVSPATSGCALSNATPLTVTVTNGVTAAITDIYLYYQLDGGTVVRDTLASLAGKSSVNFTFTQLMNAAAFGPHTLNIWVVAANDSYNSNDSIMGYVFRNEPLISSFPYLENFESGDGYWYTEGLNSSWAYGTPATVKIHKAASGVKAWKTGLAGHYNDNELSYLYSPCFNISGLTNPMLSFSTAMEIENCGGSVCDGAWVEYAVNGGAWTKLGAAGQGTNWYSSAAFQLWNTQAQVRWQVASIPLPAISQPVRFRIVMSSDAGTAFDGVAIDDIHIYDRAYPLYTGGAAGPVTQSVSGSSYTPFVSGGAVLAQINPAGGNLGNTDLKLYAHSDIIDAGSSQYFLPKNFVVNTQNAPTDSVTARLYVADADVLTLVNATGCTACSKPEDVYELGITKYDNSNISLENDLLSDNAGGTYGFIPFSKIRWVPYDAGYYAEVKLASFSELWFNTGGASHAFPLPLSSIDFNAQKASASSVLTTWQSHVDTQVTGYEVQRSENARDFTTVGTVASVHNNDHNYSYTDLPGALSAQALYYRLKYVLRDGKTYYSVTRQVIWSGRSADVRVYPNPTPNGLIVVGWSTVPGAALDVSVTDVAGRVVARMNKVASDYNNTTDVNLSSLGKGIYFLRAEVAGERFDFKVVIR